MDIQSILKSKGSEVRTIEPDATVAETLQRLHHEWIGAFVVFEDERSSAKPTRCESISAARGDHRRSRGSSVFGASARQRLE
jgi:hypothetical protein